MQGQIFVKTAPDNLSGTVVLFSIEGEGAGVKTSKTEIGTIAKSGDSCCISIAEGQKVDGLSDITGACASDVASAVATAVREGKIQVDGATLEPPASAQSTPTPAPAA